MKQGYLLFHLNILFSSISEKDYPIVIEKCYWPILRLCERLNTPVNVELSKVTYDIINQIDEFKSRLAFVTIDISSMHKYLDNISKNKENNKVVINNLKNMIEFLQDETNKYTKKFLKRVKLSESTSPVIDKICQDPIII